MSIEDGEDEFHTTVILADGSSKTIFSSQRWAGGIRAEIAKILYELQDEFEREFEGLCEKYQKLVREKLLDME